jgi:3-deoxy-D-manno-octulosonic-acid transferase
MTGKVSIGWRSYGALVTVLSWLHYAVLSRFGKSDEGGAPWFRRRLRPLLPERGTGRRIWIHAVSAGESKVAELLRQRLLDRDPELDVILSATTYSGYARVKAIAGEDHSFIMPLDTLPAQRRVIAATAPDMLVLVESEFWPAQFAAAAETGVPVVVVNATMSPRSFARHKRNPTVANRTIVGAVRIFAQDEAYAARYAELGVPADRLAVTGNLKLVPIRAGAALEKSDPPMVVFGNVHRDELAILAAAVAALRKVRTDLRVVLVPRYPGKIPGEVLGAQLGGQLNIVDHIGELADAGPLVWLDEMGTLSRLYGSATIGVVCGTFADIGGHDLSEPLHAGAASIYGPDVSRQRPTHEALTVLGCAVQVENAGQLTEAITGLLDDGARRQRMIAAFRSVSDNASRQLDLLVGDLLGRLNR